MASNMAYYPDILSKDIYFNGMSENDKCHYKQKLQVTTDMGTVICSDPYRLNNWSDLSSEWPKIDYPQIIGYVIKRPGLYTLDELCDQRSLESYNFLTSKKVGVIYSCVVPEQPYRHDEAFPQALPSWGRSF